MKPIARASSAAFAALLALSACAPGDPPRADADRAAAAEPAAQPGPDPAAAPTPTLASAGERRCGWLHNPTPGNWWLSDADGEWVLAAQGGRQAPGLDEMPDMTTLGWVELNGHYGYGCACMTLSADPATRQVTRIEAAEPRPLKQCGADRALPRP
jgi:hypothetical protein